LTSHDEGSRAAGDRRALELYAELVHVPAEGRRAWIARACGNDDALRAQLEKMLLSEEGSDAFDESRIERGRERIDQVVDAAATHGEATPWMPDRIGSYRIERQLGRGGMGVVYEAVQQQPSRRVALKLIHPTLLTPERVRRFEQEVEALGRLQHPGIAQIYDAGAVDLGHGTQPWFAMERIDGVPIDEYAGREELDVRGRLHLLARVCDAIQHAHGKGVVHRDLKPDNLLVDADGRPKVVDFGIALSMEGGAESLHTQEGQILGTLGFMAPEQLSGDAGEVGPRADVYALGVVAYGLLAGRPPHDFAGLPWTQALRLALDQEVPSLGAIEPRLAGDVETIVAKATEKQASRRYASAAELGADLRRHLGHLPITARPASRLYRAAKYVRRHQGLVGGVVMTTLALLIGLAFSIRFALQASERAEENARLARRASLQAAAFGLQSRDPDFARSQLDEAALLGPATWETRYLEGRLDPHVTNLTAPSLSSGGPVGPGSATDLCVLADGTRVAAALEDGTIAAWEALEGRCTDRLTGGGPYRTLAVNAPGGVLAAATESGAVVLWDVARAGAARQLERVEVTEGPVAAVAWSKDGARLAIAAGERVFVRESGALRELAEVRAADLRFLPGGELLAIVQDEQHHGIEVLDLATGRTTALLKTERSAIDVDPVRPRVVVTDPWRHVEFREPADLRVVDAIAGHTVTGPIDVAYSSDGAVVATASAATLRTWDGASGRPLAAFEHRVLSGWSKRRPGALAIGPAGCFAALAAADSIWVWDLRSQGQLVLSASSNWVYHACLSPAGDLVAWRDELSGVIHVRDARDGAPIASERLGGEFAPYAFAADGSRLLVAVPTLGAGADAFVWDLAANRLERHPVPVERAHGFEPDAWSWVARELLGVPHLSVRTDVDVAADGGWYAANRTPRDPSAQTDSFFLESSPRVIELATGSLREFPIPVSQYSGIALRPGHDDVAVATRDGTIQVFDRRDGAIRLVIERVGGPVYGLAYSPDGERLATAGEDRAVRLHDAQSGSLLLTLHGHDSYSFTLRWSRDGKRLLSTGGAGQVRLWDAVPRAELQASVVRDRELLDRLAPRVDALVAERGRAAAADALRADGDLDADERRVALRRLVALGSDLSQDEAGDLASLQEAPALAPDAPGLAGSLTLWLSAEDLARETLDEGLVTRWIDRSGRAHDGRARDASGAPRFEPGGLQGRPAVLFGGSTLLEVNGDGTLAEGDVTIVAATTMWAGSHILRSNRDPRSSDADFFSFGVNGGCRLTWIDGTLYTESHRVEVAPHGSLSGRPVAIAALRVDRAGEAQFFLDGELVQWIDGGAEAPILMPATVGPLQGRLGDLVVFDRALTDEELAGVQRWMAERYGLL
jgi:WD40 repeat protein